MKQPRYLRPLLIGSLVVVTLAGIPGVLERVVFGHNATQTPQPVPWGLWVVAYTFFSGISAGAFTVPALRHVFGFRRFRPLVPFSLVVALVSLTAAMVFVLADLGHPERSFHVFLQPNVSSVMAWVIGLYTVYGGVLVLMLGYSLRPGFAVQAVKPKTGKLSARISRFLAFGWKPTEKQRSRDALLLKLMALVGLACSMGLGGGVGALFSGLGSRSLWHSGLFPVTFMISALLSGLSFVLGGAALMGAGGKAFKGTLLILGRLVGYLLVVELIILPAEAVIVVSGAIPSHLSVISAIAAGPYPWVFWGVQLGIGTIAAMLLIMLPKRPSLAATSVAAMFVLMGVFAFRLNFVIPELAMGDFALVGAHTRLYVPSVIEWNLVVFGLGLSGLLIVAAQRLLPLFTEETPIDFELAARDVPSTWTNILHPQGR